MDILSNILKDYGVWGLVLVAFIFIILKGQFTFQYPRSAKNNKDE
jgi:hypothetical protein